MAGDKYLDLNAGLIRERAAIQSSAGAADAGKIPALDAAGLIDSSMLPIPASGDALTYDVAQTGHGFSVGDQIYFDGTDYVLAQADDAATAEVVGTVSAVADVDNFTVTIAGVVSGLSGLTAGTVYFLSASSAGDITSTAPTGTNINKPVLLALSTTEAIVLTYRGMSGGSGASDYMYLSGAQEYTATKNFNATTLTDGATINWDLAANQVCSVTLGGNRTMAAPTNPIDGGTYVLTVIQDATGSRTLTWNAAFKWAGGVAPTLSTAANAVDVVTFVSNGTNLYGVAQIGFA